MPRRVLITGGSGFVGQWLSRAMLEQGWHVCAGTITGPPPPGVLSSRERDGITWTPLDVTDDESIARAVETAAPERVVHLAGVAFAPEANALPIRAFEVNALGAMRLLTALGSSAGSIRTLIIGSAEQYGAQPREAYPIVETATLRPLTPYAAAKAAQELIALQAHRANAAAVICTRSFNHSGVGHAAEYLLPSLVRRVRALAPGEPLRIGNGDVIRDYLHVSDVVRAYLALLERGAPGEVYNVCSGSGNTARELAERVLKKLGVDAATASDPSLQRPVDVPMLVGHNGKLRAATGWKPERSIDDIIDDLIHAAAR